MARLALFTDKGLSLEEAEQQADMLVIRDKEWDDRRLCMECDHLQRFVGWRCGNWNRAAISLRAVDAVLTRDLVLMLQRCDGFAGHN